ncbi:MAG: NADP-dependent malic enzyme [bacterium]
MDEKLYERALAYHKKGSPGKIKVVATKPLTTQEDLALAYSPGVAAPCEAIVEDELVTSEVTARGNLVAVITNGTAVLGLGAIGPLAAKPVMEGKGVLFKKFAGIDVFDIEIDQLDPDKLVDTIASLEPTFGGINLEDIKAPECFYIESELKKRMKIPVFHDDQHGTAIITSAGMINALFLVDKDISEIKLVTSGAGAAGMACLDLLVNLGLRKENIIVTDSRGVIYKGRTDYMDDRKEGYAVDTEDRTLAEAIKDADAFLGVSAPGVLTQDMIKTMAKDPIIFALANPVPEIMPELAREARPDAIIATGRSDYPNQVNNVLCFPYMFRGALDVGATSINEEMKMATVHALAELARKELSELGNVTDEDDQIGFGPEYLIPQPFDPRLLASLAPAIAKAAMDSGVATRPIRDLQAYKETLSQYVFRSGLLMKPLFDAAKKEPLRVCFAEGEEPVVLRAVQIVIDEGLARPVLIGRPRVVEMRIKKLGLRIRIGEDFELVNPEDDPRFRAYWKHYHALKERKGVTPDLAKKIVRTRTSVIASIMLSRGEVDAMLCGVVGRYHRKMSHIKDVIGVGEGRKGMYALSAMANDKGTYFFCDTYVNCNPSAEEIAECTLLAAHELTYFGVTPKVALLSHSNFGSHDDESARKMRDALQIIRRENPDLEVEGEMQADAALSEIVRQREFPNSRLSGSANLFVFPSLGSANIAFSLAREIGDAVSVGPILMGAAKSAHIMTPEISVRGIVNMTAVAVVDALRRK